MESGALAMEVSTGLDSTSRRQAWAKTRESVWQDSNSEHLFGPQEPQQSQSNGNTQGPTQQGQVPNNQIASWLNDCRTPLGASLDDQSASPSRGPLKNGCSFEDDLSLGAEANYLQCNNNKTKACFDLAADQKRSQYKEKGKSMNSTGSGKSSTVSSVSELLDLYEEDPEEILLNLGFGREEPDLSSKIPSRFFNSSSSARGIDIKVYLAAQLQRMELENPNYALTSRFRQIEVLTTVANEFFQLYSQVSGLPVQRISTMDQVEGGEKGGRKGGGDEQSSPLKKRNPVINAAKILKRTLSRHNLLSSTSESTEAQTPNQQTLTSGHEAPADAPAGTEQDGSSTNSHHQAEVVSPKHIRKKDNCPLATVTEETSGDGETGSLTDNRPEQHTTDPDLQSTNQGTGEGTQVVKEVEKRNSTPEKAPHTLAPPRLAHLRTENADSFEIEEINEDEANPHRTSRSGVDLSRTGSQQSDSSGFAEEPSADLNSHLKVQVSSDSCDSETTVTSHPSQDVATPLAMDKPAFDLPDGREEEARLGGAAESDRSNNSREEHMDTETSEQIPQYTAHHLPRSRPVEVQQDETLGKENVERCDRTDPDPEPEPEPESAQCMPAAEQQAQPESKESQHDSEEGPEHTQNPTETEGDTVTSTEKTSAENKVKVEPVFLDDSESLCPVAPASPVLSALHRAKQSNRTASQRRGISMQRSSSLPSSLLSPSKIVSSVRIQFGQGLASCTQPKYSFKYTPEPEDKKEEGGEEKEEEEVEEEPTNCLSTLIINPASSSSSKKNSPAVFPPKPIPRYLMRPSYSLHSTSPPPDWQSGVNAGFWSTQSVPDLSNQQQPAQFQQNMNANQNQPSLNPGENLFPNSHPSAQYPCPSPNLSPRFNSSPHPFMLNPALQYTPPHLHGSLPNLHHHHSPSVNHHSSLTSLHQPSTSPGPQHDSMSNLHPLSTPTSPHHIPPGHLHPGPSGMYHQVYNHQYSHQPPYQVPPQGSQFGSPYFSHQGYNPYLSFPHHTHLHPTVSPEHSLHPGLAPPPPGFHIAMRSALSPGHNLHPGLRDANAPGQSPSSTEMQLRRVLHEIRGTVQSLNRADTPDTFSEPRATLPNHQTLAEFQQKRRSLNLFRSQMMDLELAIIRQQAPVYNHLSPADRLELEQLQSLRSAVREELQELEQQLEDRLMELTHHTQHRGLHRNFSVESLSTASALRAMEPVSDLLREQLFLQSEIGSDRHSSYTNPSPRSVSPVRDDQGGGDGKQKQGMYRASINITPAPPPRPNVHIEEIEEEERASDGEALAAAGGEGGRGEAPEVEEGAAGEVRVDSLQQLIKEIRESVAQEVRREIYSELLAAVSPRPSPLPARQPPV
ncbi:protein ITPRID2 isoform X3 [Pelmatolapia mariae]|uniref:protein ITPRID2 isoform X3 n=1 Tax=Pelmatolapia mariae TaxID=158779 RepID=UPI002FE658DE